jgi:RHS repeat-associated protein
MTDRLLSITDAKNRVTSFGYDIKGRLTQTTFPSTLSETYTYDAIDNLLSKTDRKSQTINYVYDALNRLTHKGYPDSTGVDYVYDLVGKIRQVTDPTGTYGFAYDNMGRLIGTTTQYTFIPNQTYNNTYTYDAASNRTGLQAPDSSTTTYVYDALNRLTDQTNSWAGHFIFGYDDLSRRTSLTRPNGINTSYSYDNLSHLMSVVHQQGTTNVDGATYTYDNAGNRLSKQNLLNNITEHYDYDAIYQLKHVIQDLSGGGQTTTESYTYDQVGNRLSALNVAQYNYDSSNHLNSSSDGVTYTYDNNGNTLTKTDANGTIQYAWDFENRLTSVTLPNLGGVVTFKYDPLGRRIQKSSASTTSSYVYDGSDLLVELDGAGNAITKYGHGPDTDEPLATSHDETLSFYEADGLGSVISISDSSASLSNTYNYEAFGSSSSTGTLTNSFRYTGREFDSETALLYLRARYLDSTTGRFLSEDPVNFAGGINFYRYAANNPIAFVDPSGLAPKCPNCSIVVKCTGIKYKHLGLLGVRHCEARVVDRDGIEHSLSGGPVDNPLNSDLNAWNCITEDCKGKDPLPPFQGHTVFKKNPADCDQADCLISRTQEFHDQPAHPKYHAVFGPNSDTWLKNTFGACGMHLHIRWYGPPILFFWPLP